MAEPVFLGPTEDHIQILWAAHARKRLCMRYNPPGKTHEAPPKELLTESVAAQVDRGWIPLSQIETGLRHPTASDLPTSDVDQPDRFLRMIRLKVGSTIFHGTAVCEALDPPSNKTGRIRVVTMLTPTRVRPR